MYWRGLAWFLPRVCSAFKGRMWSIHATIRDQSYLNSIRVESRMQGDREELKIFLKNCLIALWFDQKLRYKGKNIDFYKKKSAKIADRPIRWRPIDGCDRAMIVGHDPTIAMPVAHPMKIGLLWCDNMQFHALISCILCIYSLKYNHKCMLSWFKMTKLIISMF